MRFLTQRRRFSDLSEQEVLALAISSEEDDARIYRSYGARLRAEFPDTAKVFDDMAAEEDGHRQRLIALHQRRFGDVIPLIRREHVAGYYARRPVWLVENLGIEQIRAEAEAMERGAEHFYLAAAKRTQDADTRKLLGDLAAAEAGHQHTAGKLQREHLDDESRASEDRAAHRQFVLTWVQPGLAGLMDGSVSTLAPILPRLLPPKTHGPRFWWAWRPRLGRGFPWALPRRPRMMVNYRGGAAQQNVAWQPV